MSSEGRTPVLKKSRWLLLKREENLKSEQRWFFAVSGGLTGEIKFACHQIDDAGEVAERRCPRALAFAAVPDC
jgi:hypothetical protein